MYILAMRRIVSGIILCIFDCLTIVHSVAKALLKMYYK
jgi:hypothetical protein